MTDLVWVTTYLDEDFMPRLKIDFLEGISFPHPSPMVDDYFITMGCAWEHRWDICDLYKIGCTRDLENNQKMYWDKWDEFDKRLIMNTLTEVFMNFMELNFKKYSKTTGDWKSEGF